MRASLQVSGRKHSVTYLASTEPRQAFRAQLWRRSKAAHQKLWLKTSVNACLNSKAPWDDDRSSWSANLGSTGTATGLSKSRSKPEDVGFDVVYEGIRVTPEQIAASALEEGVHLIGLSILSGSHAQLVPDVVARLKEAGLSDVPLIVGGIIPDADAAMLKSNGVARVYTPKDFALNNIMEDLVELIETRHAA